MKSPFRETNEMTPELAERMKRMTTWNDCSCSCHDTPTGFRGAHCPMCKAALFEKLKKSGSYGRGFSLCRQCGASSEHVVQGELCPSGTQVAHQWESPPPSPGKDRTLHSLKTWPEPFDAVWRGVKTFEVRHNDRNFQAFDRLQLQEWDPQTRAYTGREVHVLVTYLVGSGAWDLPDDIVVMGWTHRECKP